MRFFTAFLFVILLSSSTGFAQNRSTYSVSGKVVEKETSLPLPGVNVALVNLADTTRVRGEASLADGTFRVANLAAGTYRLRVTFVGYLKIEREVELAADLALGTLEMEIDVKMLDEVRVEAVQDRVTVKEDTLEYNAAAFQVNQQASTEDLLAKMPGVRITDNGVEAQGQQVQRVLVDGREFFGDDPSAALKNLPAEVVDKIQVYDRMSDQAEFTGFDDGNTAMTINVITKTGRNNGQFGKVYGGYGTEERYISGGNINIFDDSRRISLLGLTNNINQQNFTSDDILGALGGGGGRGGRGGGGFRGGGGRGRGGDGGGGGRRGGGGLGAAGFGGNPGNFLVGSQAGVTKTNALGLNYSDEFGSKLTFSGSYFLNDTNNSNNALTDREYFLGQGSSQLYDESEFATTQNTNHRITGRLQYRIDEKNSIIFSPRLTYQGNDATSLLFGANSLPDGSMLNQSTNDYLSTGSGWNSSASLLVRHGFAREGRTLTMNVNGSNSPRSGDTRLYAENTFFETGGAVVDITDQQTIDETTSRSISTNLNYTEPIGGFGQVQLSYTPSWSVSTSDRNAFGPDGAGAYTVLDPTYSNVFDNNTFSQRMGASLRFNRDKLNLTVGADVQTLSLTGDQTFPLPYRVDRSFSDVLPNALLQYRFSRTDNLRIFYRTSTNTPSISQLQNVIDNRNPLFLSTGNPDLDQSYQHSVVARLNKTRLQNGEVIVLYASFSKSRTGIGTESLLAVRDTLIAPGVTLSQGAQFSRPVNIKGGWNGSSLVTYGRPFGLISSNLNLSLGYSYNHSPGIINGADNVADTKNYTTGLVIGSNISPDVDFTVSYTLNYNDVQNSAFPELDADYFYHRSQAKVTVLPVKSLSVETSVNMTKNVGLGKDFDRQDILLNAGLGYRFLKGNGGEVKLLVADILNRNNAISRSVNEFYVQDQRNDVLGRYILLNFTYTLRNFRIR